MRRAVLWFAPPVAALAVVGAYVIIEDTDAFFWIWTPMAALLTVLLLVGAAILAIVAKPRRVLAAAIALSAVVLVPAALGVQSFGRPVRDEFRVLAWSAWHGQEVASGPTRVVRHWEATGWGGMRDDTYLVVDSDDALAPASSGWLDQGPAPAIKFAAASRWGQVRGLACDIVGVERIRSGLYLIATSDCVL
ncbi:MAG TPA: hypothetical protein VGG29_15260 [Caulobacteraceae bacterium]|jgi:hypothetical protein